MGLGVFWDNGHDSRMYRSCAISKRAGDSWLQVTKPRLKRIAARWLETLLYGLRLTREEGNVDGEANSLMERVTIEEYVAAKFVCVR